MLRNIVIALLCGAVLPLSAQNVTFANHASTAPGSIAAHGDFNNDGREDFLFMKFVDPSTSNQTEIQTRISTADGSYKGGSTYVLPVGFAGNLALADFNRDGRLDFAVAVNKTIYVYFGNGVGGFSLGRTINVGKLIVDIAAADFNGDSKTDLVVLTQTSSESVLSVYFGNGYTSFSRGPVTSTTFAAEFLRTGDFDGDGHADVATISCQFGCSITAFYGDGTGKFDSPFNTGTATGLFVAADVNGDGRSDLVGGNSADSPNGTNQTYIEVLYGNADRTLTSRQITTSQCPLSNQVAVGDFNGDGIPDLIVSEGDCSGNSPSEQVAFLAGHGSGHFGPEQFIFNSTSGAGFDAATILGDRDTEPDLAFTQSASSSLSLQALLNSTAARFPSCAAPHGIRGISVCSPLAGSTVSSPVHFAIGAAGSIPMRKVEVWVDGKKLKQVFDAFSDYAFMDTSLALSRGTHRVTVFAAGWDNSLQRTSFTLRVR